ncbi:IclR family transcriptional regulator [Burkholderia multivorans]|nr:IclR family transcriptional regulator [Burkholderia multivorans]MBU9119962.1 IclR family transcriptional regulator [Burkholderia multivorans]MBU9232793.1 IclR family transcriptional regulator [Burkholderia multivorans]MBU9547607.1 IclR family transcriptional regulator [Burkholderia multivorans]MBU9628070.1 IclR family transcriptional regulator [Burkholderia multivorans]
MTDMHSATDHHDETPTAELPGPRATTRIVHILRLLAELPDGATLTHLSELTATPKTSLLALLRALTFAEYLVHSDGKYSLGVEAFKLGAAIVAQRRFPEIARPVMERIAREAGETVLIGQLASDRPSLVYIMSAESRHAIRFIAGIGERRELYSSSGGRILLAFMPAEKREQYLKSVTPTLLTPYTTTNKRELRRLIGEAASSGIAITVDQNDLDVVGFGAPILNEAGEAIATLVMGTPKSRGIPQMDRFKGLILEGAREISQMLGFDPSPAARSNRKTL